MMESLEETRLPCNLGAYTIYSCIGQAYGRMANVYLSKDNDNGSVCCVRACSLENEECDLSLLTKEISAMRAMKHPNVLPLLNVLTENSCLLLVTPLMNYGSVRDLLLYRFNFGLVEQHIATILKDVIKGLKYMHDHGWMHRAIRCSHILLSSNGTACLSGLRLASSVIRDDRQLKVLHEFDDNFKSTLLWLAPEVLQQSPSGYDLKSDIYSLGIATCEMANGFPPFADMSSLKMFVEKLRGITPRLLDGKTLSYEGETNESAEISADEHRNRWFSDKFHALIDFCLKLDPKDRPNATQLLKNSFFKQYKKDCAPVLGFLHDVKPMTLPNADECAVGATIEQSVSEKADAISCWSFE